MVIGTSQHRSEGSHGRVPFKSPNSVKGRMLSHFSAVKVQRDYVTESNHMAGKCESSDSNPRLNFSLNIYNMHSKVIPSVTQEG